MNEFNGLFSVLPSPWSEGLITHIYTKDGYQYYSSKDFDHFIVATKDGSDIGVAKYHFLENNKGILLDSLFVEEKYRQLPEHIGTQILRNLIRFESKFLKSIRHNLYVHPCTSNEPGSIPLDKLKDFYEKHGFILCDGGYTEGNHYPSCRARLILNAKIKEIRQERV